MKREARLRDPLLRPVRLNVAVRDDTDKTVDEGLKTTLLDGSAVMVMLSVAITGKVCRSTVT